MATIIRVDGTTTEVDHQMELEELQQAVGGYIEQVSLGNSQVLIVNEEGRLKQLAYNSTASIIAGRPIVGNAVLCQVSPDGNLF